jgi:hypothetical protein
MNFPSEFNQKVISIINFVLCNLYLQSTPFFNLSLGNLLFNALRYKSKSQLSMVILIDEIWVPSHIFLMIFKHKKKKKNTKFLVYFFDSMLPVQSRKAKAVRC